MYRLKRILYLVLPALLTIMSSCAHIVKPTGGPKDKKGPEVIGAIPPPRVLNYQGDRIVIYFDEFLKPGNYAKDVFVSPVPPIPPTVTVKNKRLTVKFNAPLRDSTTYVITLGTEIKDFNEGNKLDEAFVYAFSTGDQLDSLTINGKVNSPWEGTGQKGMKVLLFLADDVEGNDIFGMRPVYASETDENGEFSIQYLREAEYKIYAILDADNDYAYSNAREQLGITENPVVNLADSADRERQIEMYTYIEDKNAPTVRSTRWANDYTVHVEFSESIRDSFGDIHLQISMLDSAAGDRRPVKEKRYVYKSNKHLYFVSPFPREKDLKVTLENVMDTLGTFTDTTMYLAYDLMSKKDAGKLFLKPIIELGTNHIQVYSTFVLPAKLDTSQVQIVDSSAQQLALKIRTDGLVLHLDVEGEYDQSIPYELQLKKTIPLPDGNQIDSLFIFPIKFTDSTSFGSLSGNIMPDTLDSTANLIMVLLYREKKSIVEVARVKGPGPFSFPYLAPGAYTIKIIRDTDKNGYLSPGSLDPYFLPEKVIVDPAKVQVKANWEVQDYNVFPYLQRKKSNKSRRGELEEPLDNEEDKKEKPGED